MNGLWDILRIAAVQGAYDFAGWNLWLGEPNNYDDWQPKFFRVVKEVLDFVVTPLVLIYWLHMDANTIGGFYAAKWLHLCDSFYNVYDLIWNNREASEDGYWRWWTPIGLVRTVKIMFMSKQEKEILRHMYHDNWWKGRVSIQETWWMTGIGLVLAWVITEFRLITGIWEVILGVF